MRFKLTILGILAWSFLTIPPAPAQIVFLQKGYFSSSVVYTGWSIQDSAETELEQWVGVVRVFLPLADNLELHLFSTGAVADLTLPASDRKRLSGVNDTRVQGAFSFADDTFLLTLGLNLPTGKKSLTTDEVEVTRMLADNSLRFPVRRYGEGFGVSAGLATAQKLGELIVGLGGGYLFKGEYTPLSSSSHRYRPGDELTICVGLDVQGERSLLRLDGIYTRFMKDRFAGEEIYHRGAMYEMEARLSYEGEKANSSIGAKAILRGKDRLLEESEFLYEEYNSHRNEYRGDCNLGIGTGGSSVMSLLFEIRALDANQYPQDDPLWRGKSMYYGGGAGLCLAISESASLNLAGKYLVGKTDGDTKDLTGINAEAGITFEF